MDRNRCPEFGCRGVSLWMTLGLLLPGVTLFAASRGPSLAVTRPDVTHLDLAWTNNGAAFALESASALSAAAQWQRVATPPEALGEGWTVQLAVGSAPRFFRLIEDVLPGIESASPASMETGVSVLREVVLRFPVPVAATSFVATDRFRAVAGGRTILGRVEMSTDRRVLTWFPLEPLPGGAEVRAEFNAQGLMTSDGRALDGDGDGVAGGTFVLRYNTSPTAGVPGTAVLGRVFASELESGGAGAQFVNRPLEGVTVTVDGAEQTLRAVTDAQGNFVLTNCPAGRFFVHVDGRTAVGSQWPWGAYYPFVGKAWVARAGTATNLAGGTGEIFLPRIREETLQETSSTAETRVTFPSAVLAQSPSLAGVSVTIPANALFMEGGGRGGRVGIAPVAPDRLPEPLPPGLNFPLVITIQTDGPQNLDRPAPVRFPNLPDPLTGKLLSPGEKTALWSFNHDTGRWEIQGPMTVSADGKFVDSDPGYGVRQPGWHGTAPGTQGEGGPPKPPKPKKKDCPSDLELRVKEDFLLDVSAGMNVFPGSGNYAGAALQNYLLGDGEPQHYGPGSGPSADLEASPQVQNNLNDIEFELGQQVRQAGERNSEFPTAPNFEADTSGMSFYGENNQLRYTFGSTSRSDNKAEVSEILITPRADGGFDYEAKLTFTLKERYEFNGNDDSTIDGMARQIQDCGEATPFNVSISFEKNLKGTVRPRAPSSADLVRSSARSHDVPAETPNGPGIGLNFPNTRLIDAGDVQIQVHPDGRVVEWDRDGLMDGTFRWVLEDLDNERVLLRGESLGGAELFHSLILPPNRRIRAIALHLQTRAVGEVTFTSNSSGLETRIPPLAFRPENLAVDNDGDGLEAVAERILGTRPDAADTDGDGVVDGAELRAGTDLLDGRGGINGVVASVDVADTTTVIAAGANRVITGGLGVLQLFNTFGGLPPRLVGAAEVGLFGVVSSIAIEGDRAAAAVLPSRVLLLRLGGSEGLQVKDDLAVNGALCVALGGGYAYVAGGTGLTVIDVGTGGVVGTVGLSEADAVVLVGDLVIVGAGDDVVVLDRWEKGLKERGRVMVPSIRSPLEHFRELVAGDGIVYRAGFFGVSSIRIDIPDQPVVEGVAVPGSTAVAHAMAVASGGRLGVLTSSAGPQTLALSMYDVRVPSVVTNVGATLETGRYPRDVVIADGLAYLVSDLAPPTLNVVRFDQGSISARAPAIRLEMLGEETSSGSAIVLQAHVEDDGLVTRVEFWRDDTLLGIDTTYPFELRHTLDGVRNGGAFQWRARAQDDSGLATWSETLALTAGLDHAAPRLVDRDPTAGSAARLKPLQELRARFNEALAPDSMSADAIQLIDAGRDGVLGTADDLRVPGAVTLSTDGAEGMLRLEKVRYHGLYRVTISGVRDLIGNSIAGIGWDFRLDVPSPLILLNEPSSSEIHADAQGTVHLFYDRPIDPATVKPDRVQVRSSGLDGQFETPDDILIPSITAGFLSSERDLVFQLAQPAGNGRHRVEVSEGLIGLDRNVPAAPLEWEFEVLDVSPPQFLFSEPARFGRTQEDVSEIVLRFDEMLDPRSVKAVDLKLLGSGADAIPNTADDLAVAADAVDAFRDEQGAGLRFHLAQPLIPGRWRWSLSEGVRDGVGLAPETLPTGDFTQLGSSSIQGQILLPDGKPASGASIVEVWSGTKVQAGEDGRFEMDNVPFEGNNGIRIRAVFESGPSRALGEWAFPTPEHRGALDMGSVRTHLTLGERISTVLTADLNGDGTLELIVGGQNATTRESLLWIHTMREGGIAPVHRLSLGTGQGGPGSISILPLKSGDAPAVLAHVADVTFFGMIQKLHAITSPLTREVVGAPTEYRGLVGSLAFGEVTGDGRVDAVAALPSLGQIVALEGDGNGQFALSPVVVSSDIVGVQSVVLSDVNGDGLSDLVAATAASVNARVRVLLRRAGGGWEAPVDTVGLSLGDTLQVLEVTGDTFPDLVVGMYGGAVRVIPGTGDGHFSGGHLLQPPTFANGVIPRPVAIDVNNDGAIDLLTPSATGQFLVWLGPGVAGGNFQLSNRQGLPLPFIAQFLMSADLDGNGRPEILAVSSDGEFLVLLPERDFGF